MVIMSSIFFAYTPSSLLSHKLPPQNVLEHDYHTPSQNMDKQIFRAILLEELLEHFNLGVVSIALLPSRRICYQG